MNDDPAVDEIAFREQAAMTFQFTKPPTRRIVFPVDVLIKRSFADFIGACSELPLVSPGPEADSMRDFRGAAGAGSGGRVFSSSASRAFKSLPIFWA